jgi:hypothetical protein
MYINWDRPFFIDPSTGESVPEGTEGAVPFPTYGNYGGGGYSAGEFGGELITEADGSPYSYDDLLDEGNELQDPVDLLDYLSYRHDLASANTGPGYDAAQAQADATHLSNVVALNARPDPEMALYAGATTFGMIGSLALHGFLGVLSPLQVLAAVTDAVRDIHYGLKKMPPLELADALNFIFEPSEDANVFVFDFAITTTSFRQELAELAAMRALNAVLDRGELDDVTLNTGFPFAGTSEYYLAYNAITGDLDLNAAA